MRRAILLSFLIAGLAGCGLQPARQSCLPSIADPAVAAAAVVPGEPSGSERTPEALLCRALVLNAHGREDDAIREAQAAVRLAPADDWLVSGGTAPILAGRGETQAAVIAWEKGIAGAEKAGEQLYAWLFRDRRAVFLANKGDYRGAQRDWQQIYAGTTDEPQQAAAAFNITASAFRAGDVQLAEEWGKRARGHARASGNLELERQIEMLLGQGRSNVGDYAGAAQQHAAELRVADPLGDKRRRIDAAEALGQALFDAGDLKGGSMRYRQAIAMSRALGENAFAGYLEGQLRTRTGMSLSGNYCMRSLQDGRPDAAERSVEAIAPAQRTTAAIICQADAIRLQDRLQQALFTLRAAAENATSYDDCRRLMEHRIVIGGEAEPLCEARFPGQG